MQRIEAGITAEEAAVLGLEPHEADPVRIILAAQLRLRRCRKGHSPTGGCSGGPEVRRIIAARDALLEQAVGTLASRGLGGPAPGAEAGRRGVAPGGPPAAE